MNHILSESQIAEIPKVEFHRHLDGSVRIETIHELNKFNKLGIKYQNLNELKKMAVVEKPMNDLTEVLAKFEITQKIFCNYEAIKRVAFENVEDAFREGAKLVELRFAPLYMLENKTLSYDEVLEGIVDGLIQGIEKYDIGASLIYIQPRGFDFDIVENDFKNLKNLLDKRNKFQEHILGFDIADEETLERIHKFSPIIKLAKESGLQITVHSGEDTNPELMDETIELYDLQRIGHGIRAVQSEKTMETLIKKNICLEVCVHSNYLTQSVKDKKNHPIKEFFAKGVPFNISSDDPHIFNTDLIKEYKFLNQYMNFSSNDFARINKSNLQHSFLNEDKVDYIRKKFFDNISI